MDMIKIDAKGHKLREDAAASYRRMQIAGMPTDGIVVGLRTMAEQQRLYDLYKAGKGNLAAKPSPTAPHITGRAMDVQRGSKQHTWLTKGGIRLTTKLNEKIRANRFGFKRTVPSEAWHFFYTAANDKYSKGLPVLSFGSRDIFVTPLQRALGIAKPTGFFGPVTRSKLKAAQKRAGLPVTGKTDLKTWAALGIKA